MSEAVHVFLVSFPWIEGFCRQGFERAIQRQPHVFSFSITMRRNLPPTFSFGSQLKNAYLCRYIDTQRSLRRFQHPLLATQIAADRRQNLEIAVDGLYMGLAFPSSHVGKELASGKVKTVIGRAISAPSSAGWDGFIGG
jgi:hypothetical protein